MSDTNTPKNPWSDKPAEEGMCCLCDRPIQAHGTWTLGNNAEPMADGRCCDDCNEHLVIPERMARLSRKEDPREVKPLHPFPGRHAMVARAWHKFLLEPDGEGAAGYTQPCTLWLTTAEVHDLIVVLIENIGRHEFYSEQGAYMGSKKLLIDLAYKLDTSFRAGLNGSSY